MRRLIFVEVYKCFAACFTLLCLLGLMMGVLWSTIWFGVLANIGGASTLASLLITVHLQEINPILTTVVVVMTYGGPMTLELALMKSSREFNSLQLMGIPPEHLLAWPKLIGLLLAFPGMLLLMTITTFLGAYWGIVKAIDLPLIEFISDLALAIEPFHILMLAIKSILISIAIGFFCLYQAWQTPEGDIHQAPAISRRAMSESFVFGTLAEVLVTIFYG
jgi:ABC-type transporter Mla maintaining outer membrane lipid asymmetry permease subunit MlaE